MSLRQQIFKVRKIYSELDNVHDSDALEDWKERFVAEANRLFHMYCTETYQADKFPLLATRSGKESYAMLDIDWIEAVINHPDCNPNVKARKKAA